MEDRDQRILSHIARYRVSTPAVIRSLFFANVPAAYAPVMDRLRNQEGLVKTFRVLKDNRSYHQLTREAVRILGLPETLAKPIGRQALLTRMAILWFCTMNGRIRNFVSDNAELAPLFEGVAPVGYHCTAPDDGRRIYHLYAVMPDTKRDNLFKTITIQYRHAADEPAVGRLIEERRYGFAILVNTEMKKQVIERFLRGKLVHEPFTKPLAAKAHFCVEYVPDFEKGEKPTTTTQTGGSENV